MAVASACTTNPSVLDIYFVDVEGGQATLLVTPNGESLLIDTGYPGQGKSDPVPGDPNIARDAQRILAAAQDANVSRINHLLVTHIHGDHFGGTIELAELIPIDNIYDPGTEVPEARGKKKSASLIALYKMVREKINYTLPKPGDRVPLKDVEVTIVSSAGDVLDAPLQNAGAPNSACDRPILESSDPYENPRSLGILVEYGEFRFLDLGDLAGQPLSDLVCPRNLVGRIDAYLVPHHGGADSADPATLAAFRPRIAVLNNGATKGGAPAVFDMLRNTAGLEDVWQIHRSDNDDSENFASEQIANLDTSTEYWIKLSASADGSFQILNARTGVSTSYEYKEL
jgi:beta-lactamase superfamily II metal-dependent hydrolase